MLKAKMIAELAKKKEDAEAQEVSTHLIISL